MFSHWVAAYCIFLAIRQSKVFVYGWLCAFALLCLLQPGL